MASGANIENLAERVIELRITWRFHFVKADVAVGWRCLVCVLVSENSENAKKLSSVIKLPHAGRLWE